MAKLKNKDLLKKLSKFGKNHMYSLLFLLTYVAFFTYLDLIHNEIIYINLIILFIGIFLYEMTGKVIFLFMFIFIYILNELMYLYLNLDIYPNGSRPSLIYSAPRSLSEKLGINVMQKVHNNLTESNFPEGNRTKCIDSDEGEINRFKTFIKMCDMKPGDVVLNMGCGFGGFVEYCRKKGIEAYGITISKGQSDENSREKGDWFYWGDYTKFKPEFVGKFDHIVLDGTLEHTFSGSPLSESTQINKAKKTKELFTMFKKYYKEDSTQKKLLTDTVHFQGPTSEVMQTTRNKFVMYCKERFFGGSFFGFGELSAAAAMKNAGYVVLEQQDRSWDYYYSTYCDINNWGNPYNIPSWLLLSFPINQFIIHTWIYWTYGMWMWLWSGKLHTRRDEDEVICDPNKTCDLEFEEDITKRPGTLYYTVSSCANRYKRSTNLM